MKKHGSIETPAPRKPGPAPRTDTLAYAARQAGVSPETARYRLKTHGSIEKPSRVETMRDFGFGSELTEFIEWLTEDGWPRDIRAAQPLTPVTHAIAPTEVAEPVGEPTEPIYGACPNSQTPAEGVKKFDTLAEDSAEPSVWDGCFIETDGVRVYVTAYAAEHGISDRGAAIELGVCEPEGEQPDEKPAPEQIAQPAFIERTRKLTKSEKKALKKSDRADRLEKAQPKPNGLAPTMLKAFVHVMFELAADR
jgi:hypothetical protein